MLLLGEKSVVMASCPAKVTRTERAELVNGFDDAFALLCSRAAAPFAFQRDVEQLLLLLFRQRYAQAQLIGERRCTAGRGTVKPGGDRGSNRKMLRRANVKSYRNKELSPYVRLRPPTQGE